MEALMDSAVFLGREASLDLCTKSSTAFCPSTDNDWQIVSICSPGALALWNDSSQAAARHNVPPLEADCSDSGTGDPAENKLDLCTLDLGLPCTSRKVKMPRSRRGKPKLSASTVALPDSAPNGILPVKIGDEPVVTPMTVELSLDAPYARGHVNSRMWNPFARFLSSQRQQPDARMFDVAGLPFPPGNSIIDSEFGKDRRLSSCSSGPDDSTLQARHTAHDGYDSEPDIDAIMACGAIDIVDNTFAGFKAEEVTLDRKEPSLDYDTAQEAIVRKVATNAANADDGDGEGVGVAADSDSGTAALHIKHVVQAAQGTCETKQASVLRGAKKNKKCQQAARRKEKMSKNVKKGGM